MLASRNNNGSLAIWRLLQTGWAVVPPTRSIRDTWELVRNADFQALPKLTESEASLVAQTVKSLPAIWKTWVQSMVGKIPWRRKMATHSSILAWEIPWPEEPGGLQSRGSKEFIRLSN